LERLLQALRAFADPSECAVPQVDEMSCWEANNSDERCTTGMALPDDVLQHILTFCSPLDVARLACVNARMHRVCASDAVWLPFFERHFMRANGFPSLAASKAEGWQKV
jgi:hypothetical protein